MRARSLVSLLAVLLVVPLAANAAPGDLDPTFGDGGRATAAFGEGSGASDVALLPDGKLVMAGWIEGMVAVMRFEPNGAVDADFGQDGAVAVRLGHQGDEANAVAIQPNGKIVIAGTDSRERFVVIRFRADGDLDPSFSGDGIARTRLDDRFLVASDLAIQPDGRIVVVGRAGTFQNAKWGLARYRPDGRLDRTFGDGGLVRTSFGWGFALGVALQPDDRIVVTGYSGGLAVARYLPNGRLDPSFGGGDGKVGDVWPIPSPPSALTTGAIAIRSNGKIVLGGDYDIFALAMARLLPDGALDRSFGGDGIVRIHVAGTEQGLRDLVLRPHGKVVAAGYAGPHESVEEGEPRFVVIRVLPDGSLDDSWSGDGRVETFFPGSADGSGAVVCRDGRLVVVGSLGLYGDEGVALARYLS